jgi:hypothetical protein
MPSGLEYQFLGRALTGEGWRDRKDRIRVTIMVNFLMAASIEKHKRNLINELSNFSGNDEP